MNKNTLNRLVKIADELDRKGLRPLADKLDQVIEDESGSAPSKMFQSLDNPKDIEIDIPEAELDSLKKILESLKQSLE